MNCLIVDDQDVFREIFKRLMELDPTLVLAGECADARSAYQRIMNTQVDLVFLDIEMPGMSGMELARLLRDKPPLIIFTTSDRSYAVEAFELNAVDFLLKPISPARFLKAIERAKKNIEVQDPVCNNGATDFVFIRDSNMVRKLTVKDILYIEAIGDYIRVVQKDQEYFINSSLKLVEKKFSKYVFFRVHRSFIVNLHQIDTIEGKILKIGQYLIPISNTYRNDLKKYAQFFL